MARVNSFSFVDPSETLEHFREFDTFQTVLPKGLGSVESLMLALSEGLLFPGYFGHNWNALSDVLRDFHWLEAKDITLIHQDLPSLALADLKLYLEILEEAVSDRRGDNRHRLIVVFPMSSRSKVAEILESGRTLSDVSTCPISA